MAIVPQFPQPGSGDMSHVPPPAVPPDQVQALAALLTATLAAMPPVSSVPAVPQVLAVPPAQPHTVRALFAAYTKEVLPSRKPTTRYQHERLMLWMLKEWGDMLVTELTPAFLRQWRDALLTRGYGPGTVCRYLGALSGILTFAVNEVEWLDKHPLRSGRVRKPPQPKGRTRFLTEEELTALLEACKQSHNQYLYPIVVVALHTGMRKEEIRSLQWSRVNLERGTVTLFDTKNGDTRVVPLTGEALVLMKELEQQRHPKVNWCFPRWDGLKPTEFERAWEVAVRKIPDFRFHDLRHSAASYLAMSGASLLEVARFLGHRNIQMTMKYAHLTQDHNEKVVERMAVAFLHAPPPEPPPRVPAPPTVPEVMLPEPPSMRQRILAALPAQPPGMTGRELRDVLRTPKSLSDTLTSMLRDGLITRVGPGRYIAGRLGEKGAAHV